MDTMQISKNKQRISRSPKRDTKPERMMSKRKIPNTVSLVSNNEPEEQFRFYQEMTKFIEQGVSFEVAATEKVVLDCKLARAERMYCAEKLRNQNSS